MSACSGEMAPCGEESKKDVTMLTTTHEAVMVEMGKCDALGEKIEKPETVYYYCGRMGELI